MPGRKSEAGRAAASAPASKSVREKLGEDLSEEYETLRQMLKDAASATKKVRVGEDPCQKCGCAHVRWVEIPNYELALKVAEFWANQGLGRPGEDQSGRGSGDFVVNRTVVEEVLDADRVGLSVAASADGVPEV